MPYVESGYVENGYVEGDEILDTQISSTSKKINFVIDNVGLDDAGINALLLEKVGDGYAEQVNIIFGSSLRVAQTEKGLFGIKSIVGGISQGELDAINGSFEEVRASVEEVRNAFDVEEFKSSILSDTTFMDSLKQNVLNSMSVNIVAQNGQLITSALSYDDNRSAYVLDYDTSLLDGTNYTIEIAIE